MISTKWLVVAVVASVLAAGFLVMFAFGPPSLRSVPAASVINPDGIVSILYWVSGMDEWEDFLHYPYPRKIEVGDVVYFVIYHRGVGHVDLYLTSPTGSVKAPSADMNQDTHLAVVFHAVIDEPGIWNLAVKYFVGGSLVDSYSCSFAVSGALVSTSLSLDVSSRSVAPGEQLTFSGMLTRDDTGAGIYGRIRFSCDGSFIGSVYTDVSGSYSMVTYAPLQEGSYTYTAEFVPEVGIVEYGVEQIDIYEPASESVVVRVGVPSVIGVATVFSGTVFVIAGGAFILVKSLMALVA